ncbi:hypothetical protein ACH4UM_21490 [Streptomyces sp. NPDC020801]|uniref:hypothetical protein n=1 Tax=unclassified Streptomyces TaxID=2593676 RepID=UPI003790E3E8
MNNFDDLVSLDLHRLVEVLASQAPAEPDLEPGQWLGVVELLTMRLTEGFKDLPMELRGTCSVAFAHVLEKAVATGAIDHSESVIRRLNLSLDLLQRVPPSNHVDILDPGRLIELLLRELPMSAEEANVLSSDWRARSVTHMRRLRIVKNLLTPGLAIAKLAPGKGSESRLRSWGQVFPLLP